MNWTQLLTGEIEYHYVVAEKLIGMVEDDSLDWKPESGENWMTMGQLLHHITNSCGQPTKGFVTGDWGLPDGMDFSDIPPEQMMPPAFHPEYHVHPCSMVFRASRPADR